MFTAVASDSVALNGSQATHLRLVEALNKLLKTFVATHNVTDREVNPSHVSDIAQLKETGDTFNVELIQTFETLLHQNAELALKRQTDVNALNMSKPSFVAQLAKWLRLIAETHVKRDKELESSMQAQIEGETGMRTVAEEHEKLSSLVAKCQETIKLWEDKKGVTLAANNVNDSICLWLSTLDGQLHSVDAKVQERDSRIAVLEAECLKQRLNVEEWKTKAQQAMQNGVNAKQTTVVALEVTPSSDYVTATVFQVSPNGDLSQVGSSSYRLTLFDRQVPFPYSKNRPSAVAGTSHESVPCMVPSAGLAAYSIPLPPGRAAELGQYLAISLPPEVDSPAVFSRDSISAILGGNWRNHHIVPRTTATDFAKRHGITMYTMSTVERNPWSPIRPGQHGYWFLPILEMRASLEVNDERHVFTGTHSGPYYYCGYYRVASLGQLTSDEWLSLTLLHKNKYVRSFCSRPVEWEHYGASSAADMISKLDDGLFQVPCVLLQCVGFDLEFYEELCGENHKFFVGKGPADIWRTISGGDQCESEDEE
ncbi:hypothetical protein V8D89_014204 [Ganoderma adspersum]